MFRVSKKKKEKGTPLFEKTTKLHRSKHASKSSLKALEGTRRRRRRRRRKRWSSFFLSLSSSRFVVQERERERETSKREQRIHSCAFFPPSLYTMASSSSSSAKKKNMMMQLIDENGRLDEDACESFLHESGAIEWNRNYGVISIMGPQSSGKSTLLNQVFKTSFKEMDELSG